MSVRKGKMAALPALLLLLFAWTPAGAVVEGITAQVFNLTAMPTYISTADGDSILVWGFGANGAGSEQYPAPTLIVNQGEEVTVNVTNYLPEPVSIVFPGQEGVTASGGTPGLLTQEAPTSGATVGTVSYTFTPKHAGTYIYQSGTNPQLQIEMGLVGALIVRPSPVNRAYEHADTTFDHEYLFLLTEIDPRIHQLVEFGLADMIDYTDYHSVLWFINGRAGPDTLADANIPWMPSQPYNALARTHPGERVLLRVIGAGRELHPFHVHGNNATVIARDGRLLSSTPGSGPDLARSEYTIQTLPGATYDALFTWTGEKLGWDIYGHAPGDPLQPGEYALDHGKPFPVILPELQSLTFGGFYSGSPFLGMLEGLPPGEGGLNLNGGLFFMWHSHTEKELVNNDIFPGGMMTMVIIEPPGVPIP